MIRENLWLQIPGGQHPISGLCVRERGVALTYRYHRTRVVGLRLFDC